MWRPNSVQWVVIGLAVAFLNALAFDGRSVLFKGSIVALDAALAVWWLEGLRRMTAEQHAAIWRGLLYIAAAIICSVGVAAFRYPDEDVWMLGGRAASAPILALLVALSMKRTRRARVPPGHVNVPQWVFVGTLFWLVMPFFWLAITPASRVPAVKSVAVLPDGPSAMSSPYEFIKHARSVGQQEFDRRYTDGVMREIQRWPVWGNAGVLSVEFTDLGNAIRALARYSWNVAAGTGKGEVRTYFSNAGSVQIIAYCFPQYQPCEIDRVMAAAETDVLGHLGDWSIGRALISARECSVFPTSPPSLLIQESRSAREGFEKEIKDAIENERIGATCSYDASAPHARGETGLAEFYSGRSVILVRRSLATTNHELRAAVNRPVNGWPMMADGRAKNVDDASDDPKLIEAVDRMIAAGEKDEDIAAAIQLYKQTARGATSGRK